MNKERFFELHKQYSEECAILSYIKSSHQVFIELQEANDDDSGDVIKYALERLKDSIGFDNSVDGIDNDPWLSISLISIYTDNKCFDGYPEENVGMLVGERDFVLRWQENKGLRQ